MQRSSGLCCGRENSSIHKTNAAIRLEPLRDAGTLQHTASWRKILNLKWRTERLGKQEGRL
jgi:hypothetical protein